MFEAAIALVKQLLSKPATNRFPVTYAPESTSAVLDLVARGKANIIPPVEVPPRFRGKLLYDRYRCWGCKECLRVCPTRAIVVEF